MWNWLKKKLGYHVCEEFTQWETKLVHCTRLADPKEVVMNQTTTVEYTEKFQERRCTLCGKISQESLEF